VYLRYGKDNICYLRVPYSKINSIDKTARWYEFTPDKAINMVKNDWEAGFIKLRLYLGRIEGGPSPTADGWGTDPIIK